MITVSQSAVLCAVALYDGVPLVSVSRYSEIEEGKKKEGSQRSLDRYFKVTRDTVTPEPQPPTSAHPSVSSYVV
jgi:hypothetical protein